MKSHVFYTGKARAIGRSSARSVSVLISVLSLIFSSSANPPRCRRWTLVGLRTPESPRSWSGVLGRLGTPDDLARVVLFCASGLSTIMTGSTLLADAGKTI